MNSEERFKKSLEELLAAKEFSFDAANWEKARQMIDESKSKRRIVPFIIAALLLLFSTLGAYYFLSDAPSATDKNLSNTAPEETRITAPEALADPKGSSLSPDPV